MSRATYTEPPASAAEEHSDGVYHPIFGIDGSEPVASAAEADPTNMYIGRDTIKRQVQTAGQLLYVVPSDLKDSNTAVSVGNLSELSSAKPVAVLGQKLGSGAESVEITGAMDFCTFLNGTYQRLRGVMFNGKAVFRTKRVATSEFPSFCNGNHLYLFYHERNKAWVIGMKVNAGSGACAYVVTGESSPERVIVSDRTCWHVSLETGGFSECKRMKCTGTSDGEIEPPPDFSLPPEQQIPGRTEAEAMLRSYVPSLPNSAGTFVVRESTSVPNAHVFSVLIPAGEVEHIILTKGPDGDLYLDPQYTDSPDTAANPSFGSLKDVQRFGTLTGFIIRSMKINLKRCVHGQDLLR